MLARDLKPLIQKGLAAYERAEYAREVEIWKQVAAHEPNNPHWQSNLADAFANVGNPEQAEILFQYAMSCTPPPSAAFNNYVAMHSKLGAPLCEMLPLLVVSLEVSETYEHFQRHLINVSAAFALADDPANDSVWRMVHERSCAFLDRVQDGGPEHRAFVDDCVRMFAKYETFKKTLLEQDWEAANRSLASLEQEFSQWSYGKTEANRIRSFRPLISTATQLFAVFSKLGSDTNYSPQDLHHETSEIYANLQKLNARAGVYGSRTFLDLLGWSVAELHRQSQWLIKPSGEFDAAAHSIPNSHLVELSQTTYSELGEMLQALLASFNRTLRRTSHRIANARATQERSELFEHAWRAIRATTHGIVGEYRGLSECLGREMLGWNTTPRDRLANDIMRFKSFTESRLYTDFYIKGKPQEQIGRAVLLAFLRDRGFSEVPIRGGRVDILVVHREATFVIELKIWRGPQYHEDGILELNEYLANNAVPNLASATYVVLDPTDTFKAAEYVKSSAKPKNLDIFVVNINPPAPSRQGKQKRRTDSGPPPTRG